MELDTQRQYRIDRIFHNLMSDQHKQISYHCMDVPFLLTKQIIDNLTIEQLNAYPLLASSLKMVYDEETKEDVNNNDMRPDTILEKYLFKNLASFMSMHDVLPYVDVSSKYRFLKLCLKCLRVASAKIKVLILKILSPRTIPEFFNTLASGNAPSV